MSDDINVGEIMREAVNGVDHDEVGNVSLKEVVRELADDVPFILSAPNPADESQTLLIANGNEDELYHPASAFVRWPDMKRAEDG